MILSQSGNHAELSYLACKNEALLDRLLRQFVVVPATRLIVIGFVGLKLFFLNSCKFCSLRFLDSHYLKPLNNEFLSLDYVYSSINAYTSLYVCMHACPSVSLMFLFQHLNVCLCFITCIIALRVGAQRRERDGILIAEVL